MTSLKDLILAAAAFDERAWDAAIAVAEPRIDEFLRLQRDAAQDENARLTPLLTRLVDEVEVLKAALSSASKGFESHWCNDGEPCPLCDAKEDAEDAVNAHQKRWEALK